MLEHLDMYARSQTNESPYGKYDFGRMITLRDEHTEILNNVIEVVHQDYATERFKFWDRSRNEISEPGEAVLEAWTKHLADTIEPTKLGSIAATDLELKFRRHLTMDEQSPWLCGFYHAMQGYRSWYLGVEKDLEGVPSEWLELPGICDDVREIIAPKPSWVDLLDEVTSS